MWSAAWPGRRMFTGTGANPADATGVGEREELGQELTQIIDTDSMSCPGWCGSVD